MLLISFSPRWVFLKTNTHRKITILWKYSQFDIRSQINLLGYSACDVRPAFPSGAEYGKCLTLIHPNA